jgi:hypothetical protein
MENLPIYSVPKLPIAPRGTIEGSIVPVVFGEVKVPGKAIYVGEVKQSGDLTKLIRYGDATTAYLASLWMAICMGNVGELVAVYANEKKLIEGVDYDLAHFNNGSDVFKPVLPTMPKYIFISVAGSVYSSSDNMNTWQLETSVTGPAWCALYRAGQYIVGGQKRSNSPGIWETITGGLNFTSIVYGGDKYIGLDDSIYSSPDGVTWTARFTGALNCVAYSGSSFVAVGDGGGFIISIYRSADGITWIPVGTVKIDLVAICFANGAYYALSGGFSVYKSVDDGVTWSQIKIGSTGYTMTHMGTNGKTLIATGQIVSGSVPLISYSTDGITWSNDTTSSAPHYTPSCVYWSGYSYLVGGLSKYFISSTGKPGTWRVNTSPITSPDYAVSFQMVNDNQGGFEYIMKLKGIAHLFFNNMETGDQTDRRVVCNSSNTVPELTFVVRRDLDGANTDIEKSDGSFLGNNPARVLQDILTNPQWGLGIDASYINTASFDQVAALFYRPDATDNNRLYGVNFYFDNVTTAKQAIDNIRTMTDVFLTVENGQIVCKSLYWDSDASPAKTLTDDDLVGCSINHQSWE